MIFHAHPTLPSAAASSFGAATNALALLEARQLRDALKVLLRTEQSATADFLVALADFDRRRGWEALGHANLFAFIGSELGLSPAPTYWRQEAARLLQRFPNLVEPLRQGKLCLTTMAELARVLTEENRAAVLPRFLGISSREAKEIVAELQPREAPATRTVVTRLPGEALVSTSKAGDVLSPSASAVEALPNPNGAPPSQLWAPKVDFGGVAPPVARRDEVEPLTADRSRLHVNVSRQFTRKLEAARTGLGHAIPNATIEQALEAALDLLLERQAKARGLVQKPRTRPSDSAPAAQSTPTSIITTPPQVDYHPEHHMDTPPEPGGDPREASPPLALVPTEPPPHRRTGARETMPAAVRRAVWARDQGRCNWPLDAGGACGSTHLLELDHIDPWARWGAPTVENLRVVCAAHNRLAAKQVFGERCVDRYAGASDRAASPPPGQRRGRHST